MKELKQCISEKLHLNRNIKSNNKLSIAKWFDYFKENGLAVSINEKQYSSEYYYVHFPNKKFPKFEMRTEKILGRYRFWNNIASTSKNVPLIRVKEGYEELMNSDELDKTNEDGKPTTYAFTIKNADIIINTLNKYK